MVINAKHWLIAISLAVSVHGYLIWQLRFSPELPVKSDILKRYTIDLTTFHAPPKPVKPKPFVPPAPPQKTKPPAPKPKAKPQPKPEPKPKVVKPQPISKPRVAPKPEASVPEYEPPAKPAEPAQPVAPPSSSKRVPDVADLPSKVPSISDADKAHYYRLIINKLEHGKRYPSSARRRNEQGTVQLTFTLNKDGSLQSYRISKSSGSRALDREVERLIKRVTPFPALPHGVSKGSIELSVGISFKLQ